MKYEEILYLFATKVIEDCLTNTKYAKITFNIKEEDYQEFDCILYKKISNVLYSKILIDDNIKKIKRIMDEEKNITDILEEKYIINIHNLKTFINLLTKIINEELKRNPVLEYPGAKEAKALNIMFMILLRVNEYDVNHIEEFLMRQLNFITDKTFEDYNEEKKICDYLDCEVIGKNNMSLSWDETPCDFSIKLKKEYNIHDLAKIHYGISYEKDKKVCYIYGVQTIDETSRDRSIERKLYKLNKDKEYTSVHPNQVYALIIFTKELLKNHIEEIRVPRMQLLDHSYHELLSELLEYNMTTWEEEDLENLSDEMLELYKSDLKQYMRFYNKADDISYLKTEKMYTLLFRLLEHFDNLELINDLYIMDDSLRVRVKKETID